MTSKQKARCERALERVERKLHPKSITFPLSFEQANVWREVIRLRKKLDTLSEMHAAVEHSLPFAESQKVGDSGIGDRSTVLLESLKP